MNTTTSKYDQQARAWADKYSVSMETKYLGHFKHFNDDTDTRDVYEVRVWCTPRERSEYTFRYGQSLNNSKWRETNDGPYWRRSGTKPRGQAVVRPPSLYDVLSCLTKYDPGTHEDFCGDYGYDTDSRKGLDLYLKVQEEWRGVLRLCGGEDSEMMRELRDIQ